MRKSTFTKVLALVLLMAVAVVPGAFAQEGTVVDIVVESEDHTVLEDAVVGAGLAEALSAEDAEFTVFAPTDAAFGEIESFVLDAVVADPEGLLTTLLTYHVVEGRVLSGDLAEGCQQVPTLQGGELTVCNDMGIVTVNSANVTAADLEAGNGVVHVIDAVVIPPIELPDIDPIEVEGDIITAGSSTVGPLTIAIASRWEDDGAQNVPTVDIVGTGGGFERFCESAETDVSNASRTIRESEVEACQANGRDPIEFRVGSDGMAVTVSAENDFVTELTSEELIAIFRLEVETWNEINSEWPEEPIQLYSPDEASGTFDFFVEVVLDEDEDAAQALLNASENNSRDEILVEGITGSQFAIGYFGYSYYVENADILNIVAIDGVVPRSQSVEDGSYLLARPLFIYSTAEIMQEKPQVASFIAYYLNNVNDVIGEVGYFPASNDALNLAKLKWLIATS
jgi:phosphate transport system substrate-binding protein